MLSLLICTVHLTVCYYHFAYQIQSESTLCNLTECYGNPCSKQAPYLKFKIWRLLQAGSSLAFRQIVECGLTLNLLLDMIITYSQPHRTDKYSQHSSIIWPVWLNGWVFGLRTKWLWVRITLLSLKLQIWLLLRAKNSLTFRLIIECELTLDLVRDMIINAIILLGL